MLSGISSVSSFLLSAYVLGTREVVGSKAFAAMLIITGTWSVTACLHILLAQPTVLRMLLLIELSCMMLTPLFWYVFTAQYANKPSALQANVLGPVASVFGLLIVGAVLNPLYALTWTAIEL